MAVNVGAFDFAKIIQFMRDAGFYSYLLPLLLVFAIMFAILEKTKVLGKDKTNINALVALLIGFLLVVQTNIVTTINTFLPQVSLIFIVILMCLIALGIMSTKKHPGLKGATFALASIVVLIAILLALGSSIPGTSGFLSQDDVSSILTWAIPVGIFLLAIYMLTRSRETDEERRERTAGKSFLRRVAEDIEGSDEGD